MPERSPSAPRTGRLAARADEPAPIAEGGPTRRRLRRERTDLLETRILDAAVEEFAEHGFAGARIERVSAAAGTVDRMLYYYYGNKERLYQAVLAKIYEDMIGAQREFVTPEDPVEGMRQLVLHSWDHYLSHPNLVRLLMNENLLRGKHIRQAPQVVERATLPLLQTVATLLESGQARGVFRRDLSSEHVLMTIMSLGFFYLSNQYTCATWIGADLMSPRRRAAWRAHIGDVVLSMLAVRDEADEAAETGEPQAATKPRRRAAVKKK
ncbi:TetR/AcrR family transcriptional regulator [Variovorax sp. WS11]|uniref:TetR/AcrR family transcriptional regulator n=1 Tax=Variovorax sp. WS11 TaxID=1105204 RepID=UPI0013D99CCD|nr:TetR/AcrR family transcriptional regulator [Variovorax sp. WS11]NDZ16631.1 TetR family transcriptional regulator [Variovorax sp. WS11]